VLQLDLEQPDHLQRDAGAAGDPDAGELVGREDLLDVTLGDDVAHRGAPVAGHHHPAREGGRDDGGGVRRLGRQRGRRGRPPAGEKLGGVPAEELGERRRARGQKGGG
jgi:hypothetical protein